MMRWIKAGGWVLDIIIFCSVVALGFIIERIITFRRSKTNMETFFPRLEDLIKLGKIDEAIQLCEKEKGLIPKVLLVGLQNKNEKPEDIKRLLIDEVQIHTLPYLERYLDIIGTVVRIAPMLGLFGTVLGMIQMFDVIVTENTLGDPQKLAEGIGFALVTTAGGLIVAIPLIFVHAYFKGRIRKFELELYSYLSRFLRILGKRKEVEVKES